jgi:hypothetical protein
MLGEREARIEAFVARHNHLRYQESTEATGWKTAMRIQSLAETTHCVSRRDTSRTPASPD